MLKYCSFLLLLLPILAVSQNDIVGIPFYDSLKDSVKIELTEMVVFPGCKKKDSKNFKEAVDCMGKNLRKELSKELSSYVNLMSDKGKYKTRTKVRFVVDSKGDYISVEVEEDQPDNEFSMAVVEAMNRIFKKKKASIPAFARDRPLNVLFTLPVYYSLDFVDNNPIPDIRVVATLTDGDQKLEIHLNRLQKNYWVYDVSAQPHKLIMKENEISDIFRINPFNSLLRSSGNRVLVTEGETSIGFFRIYFNFAKPEEMEVYKVVNGKEVFHTFAGALVLERDKYYGPLLSRDKIK